MESHVLNSYHRARYGIPDARIGSNSESYSSEGSCNIENSPDYPQFAAQVPAGLVDGRRSNQTQSSIKVESFESSSESENESQDDNEDQANGIDYEELVVDDDDDYEVVVGDEPDMGITEVYAVDPDLDLENSDESDDDGEYLAEEEHNHPFKENSKDTEQSYEQETLEIKLDGPVVSNVDEYFVKNTKSLKKIEVKDEVLDSDSDQLFVNNSKPVINKTYVHNDVVKLVDKSEVNVVPKVQECLNKKNIKNSSTIIDSDALPHIEKIKRFLLEDIPYAKHVKSTQRSCSLPHSPVHFPYFDANDAKSSLSFEDLNIDLTDFTFDESKNDKNDQATSLCIKDNTSNFDIPKVLTEEEVNGFLITSDKTKNDKELNMDTPKLPTPNKKHINERRASAPLASKVLNFQIEKSEAKDDSDIKIEPEDYIDVESVNDVVPVLQANNVSSLLEQFEETEKLNRNVITSPKQVEVKVGNTSHGFRLQDAAMQLNRNKMRHILMPASAKMAAMKKPSKPVLFDHDYCVPKKRPMNHKLKGGQSLLKPEVVSTNHKILSSRHRSCRNKTIDYHISSDEENGDKKDKNVIKLNVKAHTNHRKKNGRETDSEQNVNKINSPVITNEASKASDNISQSYPGIKLKIRNKSKVIIINCDVKKDSQDFKKSVDVEDFVKATRIEAIKTEKDTNYTVVATKEIVNNSVVTNFDAPVKEEPRPIKEFYTALFDNKKEVEIKLPESLEIKAQTSPNSEDAAKTVVDVKPQKKKLNLQEYKLRHGVNSNASSRTVSPEAIFPDMIFTTFGKTIQKDVLLPEINTISNVDIKPLDQSKMFDPIRDASRKILMKDPKKIKAEALRKREDDILMRKIPKVENLQLQPLISDAEMLKITEMLTNIKPKDAVTELHKPNKDYEEKILVSIGINTNNEYLRPIVNQIIVESKSIAPHPDKAVINFKIKKHDTLIKSNVFDSKIQESCPINKPSEKRQSSPSKAESKIDKERFKDITETIKTVEKQVVKKISSNSLFASIQDVVKKKAPDEGLFRKVNMKTKRVKDYDSETQHGEDKVILHLEKNRVKCKTVNIAIQTDYTSEYVPLTDLVFETDSVVTKKKCTTSESSSASATSNKTDKTTSNERSSVKKCSDRSTDIRPRSHVNRSRTRNRNERYRRSRSRSYRTPKKSSSSRNRSSNYRNRQSVSPYRRNRLPYRRRKNYRFKLKSKARSRSPCAKKAKLSPEVKKVIERTVTPPPVRKPTVSESSYSSTGSYSSTSSASSSSSSSSSDSSRSGSEKSSTLRRSRSRRSITPPSIGRSRKSSSPKSRRRSLSPIRSRPRKSITPSRRSNRSRSRRSNSPRERRSVSGSRRSLTPTGYRNLPPYRSFNSETRDNKAPVEERRIVYVGRLDKEATKNSLRHEFSRFGRIIEVKLHTNVDGTRYGFVTFRSGGEAWSLFEAAREFPQYDLGFGGRRAFCKRQYADLDGIDDEYIEQGYMPPPLKQPEDVSFEQMLLDVKNKLKQRKSELKPTATDVHRNESKNFNCNSKMDEESP